MPDIGDLCDMCDYVPGSDMCTGCRFGNPCLGCEDWDTERQLCLSNGGCGSLNKEA